MQSRPKLSVNLNKVATLRNTRTLGIPSVTRAAELCIQAGAHGITLHPRPDQRHIRPGDVTDIARLLERHPDVELNIEGNPFHGLMEHLEAVRPVQATFVPDEPNVFTSNQGWDFKASADRLRPVIAAAKALGCRVSLFVDAEPDKVAAARDVGADRVEIYTEPYALAFSEGRVSDELPRFAETARRAAEAGLGVNAGHDLNLQNLPPFALALPSLLEVSIGHALIGDALELGMAETVRRYLAALS